MRSIARRAAAFIVCVGMGASAIGCARSDMDEERAPGAVVQQGACEPAAPVVDPVLLAFLSKARAAHHQADLSPDKPAVAIRALEQLVRGPYPGGEHPLPEAGEVLADTRARLAELRSNQGEFDAALRDVDEGLALAEAPTYFRGHLFEVRGLVEERRAKALDAQGDREGAAKARAAAVDAFEETVTIQDQVISRALDPGGAH